MAAIHQRGAPQVLRRGAAEVVGGGGKGHGSRRWRCVQREDHLGEPSPSLPLSPMIDFLVIYLGDVVSSYPAGAQAPLHSLPPSVRSVVFPMCIACLQIGSDL